MSEFRRITCDFCDKDLTTCGSMPTYALRLINREVRTSSDVVFAVAVYPLLKNDLDFCSVRCLKDWIAREDL